MRPPTQEDLQFLRNIRGRYQDLKSHQIGEKVSLLLFPAIFAALSLLAFSFDPKHHWVFAAFTLGCFILFIFVWRDRGLEYEFTGDEVIERRAGRIRNRIQISDIVEIGVKIQSNEMVLKTNGSKMAVRIFPSLKEIFQKKEMENMANLSEGEQPHYEELKRKMNSRLKWTNAIGMIVLVLAIMLAGMVLVWLKKKHLVP